MNRNLIKYAPLAAEAFMSVYDRISKRKNGKHKDAELRDLLAEKVAALTKENQILHRQVRLLWFLMVISSLIATIALVLHFIY